MSEQAQFLKKPRVVFRSQQAVRKADEPCAESVAFFRLLYRSAAKSGNSERVLRAWARLTAAGVSPRFLKDMLLEISMLDRERLKKERAAKHPPQDWAVPDGLTRKKMSELPRHIVELADTIEKINAHSARLSHLHGGHPLNSLLSLLEKRKRRSGLDCFRELPDRLRDYADALKEETAVVGKRRRALARGPESEFTLKHRVLKLITAVKDVSGEPHWADLVCLLRIVLYRDADSRNWLQDGGMLKRFYLDNLAMVQDL